MKPLFNSLGSNYSFGFSLFALSRIFLHGRESKKKLEERLSQVFNGRAFLLAKGRDGIEFSLRALGIGKGDVVITQAFTCWAVENAITRAGALPVFSDIEPGGLNLTVATISKALKGRKRVKAVIVQHTLGMPADIHAIGSLCKKYKLYLIEDLAQSYGAIDSKGNEVGKYADAVVLSFGRDKIVDAVSGGAAVIRRKYNFISFKEDNNLTKLPFVYVLRDLLYPMITWLIRDMYALYIGKVIHSVMKILGIMTNPILSDRGEICEMPSRLADLVLYQLKRNEADLLHRKNIARYYQRYLPKSIQLNDYDIQRATDLRFPIVIPNPAKLLNCLAKQQLYFSDRWYRAPVDHGTLQLNSTYKKGSCQNAEELSKTIVNLPTHRNLSITQAKRIVSSVKSCLN